MAIYLHLYTAPDASYLLWLHNQSANMLLGICLSSITLNMHDKFCSTFLFSFTYAACSLALTMSSSFTMSMAKLRMPSASFSVAMASSLSAQRKLPSSTGTLSPA